MTDETDDLEKLILDVRKTISDNEEFIRKLDDETEEDVMEDGVKIQTVEEEYEEL